MMKDNLVILTKLLRYFIWFSIFFLWNRPNFAQNLESLDAGQGFLGIISSGQLDYMENEVSNTRNTDLGGKLQFSLIGFSSHYEIITQITAFHDIIRVANQYTGTSNFLKDTSIYYFTFFDFSLSYNVFRYKSLQILLGGKLGHYGFLSNQFPKNPYFLHVAPISDFFLFLGNYVAMEMKITFNIPFYYPEIKVYPVFLNTEINLLIDYQGYIRNPVAGTTLFVIGLKYDLLYFQYTDNRNILAHYISPVFTIIFTF